MLRPARTLRVPVEIGKDVVTLVCRWPVRELITTEQFQRLATDAATRAAGQQAKADKAMEIAVARQQADITDKAVKATQSAQDLERFAACLKTMAEGVEQAYGDIGATLCRLVQGQINEAGQEVPLRLCETLEEETAAAQDDVICVQRLGPLPTVWQTLRGVYLAEVTPFRSGSVVDSR